MIPPNKLFIYIVICYNCIHNINGMHRHCCRMPPSGRTPTLCCSKPYVDVFQGSAHNEFVTLTRTDSKRKLFHFEMYRKTWYFPLIRRLPHYLRLKPCAKCGIRTYSSSGCSMDEIIRDKFFSMLLEDAPSESTNYPVGILVYMWVNDKMRGQKLGDYLLSLATSECRSRGNNYMLLYHDDNGSGRLIDYYKQRAFVPIFDFIDKAMICKL